jgi:hypothetical protein
MTYIDYRYASITVLQLGECEGVLLRSLEVSASLLLPIFYQL